MAVKTAFIGLGVMGYPMAGHLARAGHSVCVFNRTAARAESWLSEFNDQNAQNVLSTAATPAKAADGADIVFACVGNDDDVREVTLGADGAFQGMASGSLFVDHTTVSAELARELAENAAGRGVGFLDAPVSGGQKGAESGILTVMVGGSGDDFARAEPVMAAYARTVGLMGPVGSGQLTKMVNQICIAGVLAGLSEGLNFADKAGLDVERVIGVISKGAAQSWQMENRWQTMAENNFDFGFAVDWMRKDLGICMAEADRIDAPLQIAAEVDRFYSEVQAAGGGRWDTSSLIARLRDFK